MYVRYVNYQIPLFGGVQAMEFPEHNRKVYRYFLVKCIDKIGVELTIRPVIPVHSSAASVHRSAFQSQAASSTALEHSRKQFCKQCSLSKTLPVSVNRIRYRFDRHGGFILLSSRCVWPRRSASWQYCPELADAWFRWRVATTFAS